MPSVLATLAALAAAAVLLRVAIDRLSSAEELVDPGPIEAVRTVQHEMEGLRGTLRDLRDRSAASDGN